MIDTIRLRFVLDDAKPIFENRQTQKEGSTGRTKYDRYIITSPSVVCRYMPRALIYPFHDIKTGAGCWALSIETSLPKLLYGNNLLEIDSTDYNEIIELLIDSIEILTSIKFTAKEVAESIVTRIDFGKNIISDIPGFTLDAMDFMKTVNVSKRLDFTQQDYTTTDDRSADGQGVRYHTKNWEFLLYDKRVDLERENIGKTRSLDYTETTDRKSLIDKLKANNLNVLRIESRYIGKRNIEQILKKIGMARAPTFRNMFDDSLAYAIINYEWTRLSGGGDLAKLDQVSPYTTLNNALRSGQNHHKTFEALGIQAVVDEVGIRKLRATLEANNLHNAWPAAQKLLNKVPRNRSETITFIDEELSQFTMIKDLNDIPTI